MLSCISIFPKVPPYPLPPPYLVWIQDNKFSRNFGPHPLGHIDNWYKYNGDKMLSAQYY